MEKEIEAIEHGEGAERTNEGNQIIEDSESQEESMIHNNENLICRFYRKDFPDENDIVIVSSLHKIIMLSPAKL